MGIQYLECMKGVFMKTLNNNQKIMISLALFLLMVLVNVLGVKGVFNGMSQEAVSAKYPTMITPAGYAFSIWSLIYLLLTASVTFQLFHRKDTTTGQVTHTISYWFWISCLCNMLWIVLFSYDYIGLAALASFAMVYAVLTILLQLRNLQLFRFHLIHPVAFSIYGGWLFVATVINVAAFLVKKNFHHVLMADYLWAIFTIFIATGLVLWVERKIQNTLFLLPVFWAYSAIYSKLMSTESIPDTRYLPYALLICLVVVAVNFYLRFRAYGNRLMQ